MSVEYDGYRPGIGFLTKLTNAVDRQQYTVSTAPGRTTLSGQYRYWETAVFKRGFFGSFRPLFRLEIAASDEEELRKSHYDAKEFVEKYSPAKWPRGAMDYGDFIMQYLMLAHLGHIK